MKQEAGVAPALERRDEELVPVKLGDMRAQAWKVMAEMQVFTKFGLVIALPGDLLVQTTNGELMVIAGKVRGRFL